MSQVVLTREQARRYDAIAIERFGVPGIVLMENAARNCVDLMIEVGVAGPIVIACGKGNNAGDGFAMARLLSLRGHEVHVVASSALGEYRGDALINRRILEYADVAICGPSELDDLLRNAEWCVDALLGTGASGDPRPPIDAMIDTLNRADIKRLAIDLPSGLDCDTGAAANPTVLADYTCTFVAPKRGMLAKDGPTHCGKMSVVDVGAPSAVLARL